MPSSAAFVVSTAKIADCCLRLTLLSESLNGNVKYEVILRREFLIGSLQYHAVSQPSPPAGGDCMHLPDL